MKQAEFAERQYETTFHLELGTTRGAPFVPTQPLEWHLGIDAAVDVRDVHRIWRILRVVAPRRMRLSPYLWPSLPRRYHTSISGRIVSLFLQFKVPKYNDAARARYRSRFKVPYFEVDITPHQQAALVQLQRRVQSRAFVRYASPAFWTRVDLDRHSDNRDVLTQSAYLIPSRLKKHKKWMYAAPTGKVVLNPEPEELESESWSQLLEAMDKTAIRESLVDHVNSLARSLGEMPSLGERINWPSELRKLFALSPEDEKYLVNASIVSDAVATAGCVWMVMIFPDDELARKELELSAEEQFWDWVQWGF